MDISATEQDTDTISKFDQKRENETNMLLHNAQENDNNLCNMEFHTTIKKQIIIV